MSAAEPSEQSLLGVQLAPAFAMNVFPRPRNRRIARVSAAGVLAALVAVIAAGCHGEAVIDTTPKRTDAAGTISGTVRGPEGTSPIEGRTVEVVNIETGERQHVNTNSAGGFTFKVKPGRYRLELQLRDGESIIKQPGVLQINSSDVDANRDIVVGLVRVSRPRFAVPTNDLGLAPPIA
jgi:carboxypeptidase family protein